MHYLASKTHVRFLRIILANRCVFDAKKYCALGGEILNIFPSFLYDVDYKSDDHETNAFLTPSKN